MPIYPLKLGQKLNKGLAVGVYVTVICFFFRLLFGWLGLLVPVGILFEIVGLVSFFATLLAFVTWSLLGFLSILDPEQKRSFISRLTFSIFHAFVIFISAMFVYALVYALRNLFWGH
jgi:hypothetical protein